MAPRIRVVAIISDMRSSASSKTAARRGLPRRRAWRTRRNARCLLRISFYHLRLAPEVAEHFRARHRISAMLMVVTALFVVVTTLELLEILLKR